MFCAATGFAGTPVVGTGRFGAERLVPVENARRIKVHFNADRSEQLPWTFTPQQKYVTVLPGETSLAFYKAKNNANHDLIGIATYNVTPDRVSYIPRESNMGVVTNRFVVVVDRPVFCQGRMFLFRGAETVGWGRG
jgi:hypothetical protein